MKEREGKRRVVMKRRGLTKRRGDERKVKMEGKEREEECKGAFGAKRKGFRG